MLHDLFNNIEFGDRTPSQLLRHMRLLVGDNTKANSILKSMWLNILPTMTIQNFVPMSEDENLERLVCKDDKQEDFLIFPQGENG